MSRCLYIRLFCSGAIVALVAAVCFFALRSSPRLVEITWLPHWLSAWADRYGVGRNVVAFGILGIAVFAACRKPRNDFAAEMEDGRWEMGLSAWRRLARSTGSKSEWVTFAVVGVFATLLEVAQLWIPGRWFDWKDIVASLAGLTIGWAIVAAVKKLKAEILKAEIKLPKQVNVPTSFTEGNKGHEEGMQPRQELEDVAA